MSSYSLKSDRCRRRGFVLQLGLTLVCAGCNELTESETSSPLTTRTVCADPPLCRTTYTETNVAHSGYGGYAFSSRNEPRAWTINDGSRGAIYDPFLGDYRFWASNDFSTVYFCNYENWWAQINFPGTRSISEIDLFSLQNDYSYGTDPTPSTLTTYYGNVDFVLQYWPENGVDWVTPPGGYITANNHAWNSVGFAPARATAVRAWLHCAQSPRAYLVELEAWQRVAAGFCQSDPPRLYESTYVGDAKSNEIIIHDSDVYWAANTDGIPDEGEFIRQNYSNLWRIGRRAAAFAQMYDLLAPIDSCRASYYLERLRVMAATLLALRDDQQPIPPIEYFHNKVMAAWGFNVSCPTLRWKTDLVIAGLFTYPMAAFARRVSANPTAFTTAYRNEAIRYTTAVIETYTSFKSDLVLQNGPNGVAYYKYPTTYTACAPLWDSAGDPQAWNENLIFMKSLAEAAIAADSTLYRSSPDSPAKQTTIMYGTTEVPRVIAKDVKFLLDHVNSAGHLKYWPTDGAAYYVWDHGYGNSVPEDSSHAQMSLGSLAIIYEQRAALDGLLMRAGYSERIASILTATVFQRFATTFLRLIWNPGNLVGNLVNGEQDGTASQNWNDECAGFIALAPFDPWVWVRCRDSAYAFPYKLREDNHAALLRYR